MFSSEVFLMKVFFITVFKKKNHSYSVILKNIVNDFLYFKNSF